MLVELGGGTNPHPRADVVIDTRHPKASPMQDATATPWMLATGGLAFTAPNDSVSEVYASHFMEHIPKGQPIIDLMNEAWRVLKPGGTFTMIMPLVGHEIPGEGPRLVDSWQPFADPTHVQYWYLPQSLSYFAVGAFAAHAEYGIKRWLMGDWVPEQQASLWLKQGLQGMPDNPRPFWSVRGGWEGVARIQKPEA